MKVKNSLLLIVVAVVVVFSLSSTAFASRGCQDPESTNFIPVDKNAPGTKYNATLTIFYEDGVSCAISPIPAMKKDMHFFMRIEGNVLQGYHDAGGSELLSFGSMTGCVQYWADETHSDLEAAAEQRQAIEDYFKYVVNPFIYSANHPDDLDGCDPMSSDPLQMCPDFALKNVNKIVEDDMVYGEVLFMMLDLIIAIQD